MTALRERLQLSQGELARRMGYARGYVNRLENGRLKISAEADERLRSIELGVTYQETSQVANAVEESPPPDPARVQLQPRHAMPARELTEQQLFDEFARIVAAAKHIPGGFGYVRAQLRLHLSADQLEKLKD
jgi:transcriptional regulator with XRE-family HTH domain